MTSWASGLAMESAGQKPANEIYKGVFGARRVTRFSHERNLLIDRELGVDCIIELPRGQVLTIQEKFRHNRFSHYPPQITVEYMQNPSIGQGGDWFNLAAQCYAVGYFNADNTGFVSFIIVNLAQLWFADNTLGLNWQLNQNKSGGRSSFKSLCWADIPASCVMYEAR